MKKSTLHIAFFPLLAAVLASGNFAVAQNTVRDTGFNKLKTIEEVTVTTTRVEKSIGDIPVPIQVISKKFIQQTGSQKLIDILQQQTGLVLAENTIVLHPYVRSGAAGAAAIPLAASFGTAGALDWACMSETNAAATTNFPGTTLATAPGAAGVRARFVPAECR